MTTTPAMPDLPDGATVLPDGSAFAIASFPLPSDHWLYAPREYRDGEEEPIELPSPILSHQAHGDIVRAAIRYAVRSATMCGKEPDFDPDALVQNAMYALCGPFGGATMQAQPTPTEHIKEPYTLAELNERIASNDYNAELLLQHAMLLLNAQPAEVSDAKIKRVWYACGVGTDYDVPPSEDDMRFARAILALRPQSESEARRAAQEQLYTERERHTAEVKRLQAEIGRLQSLRPQAVPMTPDVLELRAAAKSVSLMSVLVDGRECAVPFDQIKRLDAAIKAIDDGITAPAGGEG